MRKFSIYVGGNKAISEAVQKALHAGGGWWSRTGPDRHKLCTERAEWINLDANMEISYRSAYASSWGDEELTLHDIFNDTSKWVKSAKEMTVSEISEKLGYEVKVVK